MVYVSLETPYMTLFKEHLAKKHRLAVDAWGADDTAVRHVYQSLLDHIVEEVPEKFMDLYPAPVWKFDSRVTRLSRNILVGGLGASRRQERGRAGQHCCEFQV
jgi:hypothetical protein